AGRAGSGRPQQWAGLRRGRPTRADSDGRGGGWPPTTRGAPMAAVGNPRGASEPAVPPSPVPSRPHALMRDRYDVAVDGSGGVRDLRARAGPAGAARPGVGAPRGRPRLARAGRSVCVLGRGRGRRAGDSPTTLLGAVRQVQVRRGRGRLGRRGGLFDVRPGDDLSVLVGCGLGGTSLINAGVSLRPPAWVLDDERWPEALRGDRGRAELAPWFEEAERMLGARPYPEDGERWPSLPKFRALERSAQGAARALGATGRDAPAAEKVPIAVTFEDGPNAVGLEQRACVLCGDCVTGCNHRAKNTLVENYLPDAVAHGAELYCEAAVQVVEPVEGDGDGPRWRVTFEAVG